MKTEVVRVSTGNATELLQAPASALCQGEIVAFPTETVYGLGANALIEAAVQQIFLLKGRPQDNPLIVHLADKTKIDQLAKNIPQEFYQLYEAFCPGPLTFILEKTDLLPEIVSAGLSTVAVRFPDQRVSQELLRLADVPVVAPSANISGRPSATRASHVLDDFEGKIPFIIDDGATELGVESTVLDLCNSVPRILRPGVITADTIRERTGIEVLPFSESLKEADLKRPPSPGLKYRHYAPDAKVIQVCGDHERSLETVVLGVLKQLSDQKLGLFINEKSWDKLRLQADIEEREIVEYLFSAENPHGSAAHELYAALRALDAAGVDVILAEAVPGAEAYMNRLDKACVSENPLEQEQVKKILFVCTGNTCRSPMAAALFNAYAEEKQQASQISWRALSAGLHTMDGLAASDYTVSVLHELGIDISGHRSVQLTEELLAEADIIATMTRSQRDLLRAFLPEQESKIRTLSEWAREQGKISDEDVSDPFAQSEAVYRETRNHLQVLIESLWQQINLQSGD
ncbi:MAG: threonylcarbamoyl-AMP synthase [Clostridiaceae bacterium]|nr:threonylcarbamoyl-AMP synthase [Clostridiaceae bacterium]